MQQTGGLIGILDFGALELALAQPYMTFGGNDLYPALAQKSRRWDFHLFQYHPFADGNKRIGHAAMAMFLAINGYKINAGMTNNLKSSCRSPSQTESRIVRPMAFQSHSRIIVIYFSRFPNAPHSPLPGRGVRGEGHVTSSAPRSATKSVLQMMKLTKRQIEVTMFVAVEKLQGLKVGKLQ